ncbi:MAG: ABC transporter ATP-binding protein [Anaerolineae bacterium]|nr:ABC transporter ATP-binding protein [Anaerolineae bacterium]
MDLIYDYGERPAVNGLTFSLRKGEALALLGPNGAGKTTTVRLLNGLFAPTSGKISVFGLEPFRQGDDVRSKTGVLTETPALYERLTARQNLDFFGCLADMPSVERGKRAEELLAFFGLHDRASEPVGAYSKGMKQRLALARTLLHRPPLLFLDEPTSGLDPEAARQVHALIENIRKENGQSVVLCTHNLAEAERLCDRVGVINRGRLLALGTPDELRKQVMPGLWLQVDLWSPLPQQVWRSLEGNPSVLEIARSGELTLRLLVSEQAAIPVLVTELARLGGQLLAVRPQPISLEDVYFALQEKDRQENVAEVHHALE